MQDRFPPVSPFAAALGCRCPCCGRGALFRGFLTVAEHCDVCGLELSKADSGDGPAVFLIFILGFTVVPVTLWLALSFDLPTWAPLATGAALIIGISAVLLRPAKALVVALQYRGRRGG